MKNRKIKDELKAAVLGSAPEFAEDGYVKTEVLIYRSRQFVPVQPARWRSLLTRYSTG